MTRKQKTKSEEAIFLLRGNHPANDGVCLMEAVAKKAHEPHSDHPACSSPVIAAYARVLNDRLNDEDRQLLVPFIPRLTGTTAPIEMERKRAFLAVDWSIRKTMPILLDAFGCNAEAESLRNLRPVTDSDSAALATRAALAALAARAALRDSCIGLLDAMIGIQPDQPAGGAR